MSSEPAIRHDYAQLDGVRLHYVECGSGNEELVVLLHGFPEFWYSWRHQLTALGKTYHVVAPDMRGYNLSDKPARVEDYRGGGVAWAVAHKYPEHVSKLAVFQVPPAAAWRANITFRQWRRSWYMLFFQLPRVPEWSIRRNNFAGLERVFKDTVVRKGCFSDGDIELYKEAMRQPGALTASINYYRANLRRVMFRRRDENNVKRDGRIRVPTLFIFGEQDFAIIPETVRGVGNYVAAPYREVRIPDSGHWVQNEAVDEVNSVLIDFLL